MRGSRKISQIYALYPSASNAHLEVARNYSSVLLFGPPLCDELLALIEHMFTDEEAELVRHLKPLRARTAAGLAAESGRPVGEVKAVMHRLAHEKYAILSFYVRNKEYFSTLPIIPGTFEWVLIRKDTDSITPWHRRFAELFEALYSTGFTVENLKRPVNAVRYLPVGEAVENMPSALPADRLETILDRFDRFAVGICQCRLSKQLTGEGCGRSLETCVMMGPWTEMMIKQGRMREVSKKDVLEIKAMAEREGSVTWAMNMASDKYASASCSCCGCCCGALTSISRFNTPGMIAPPHCRPKFDPAFCKLCAKCAKACPMGAVLLEGGKDEKRLVYKWERCIGCGLCAVACLDKACVMRDLPDQDKPMAGLLPYFARYARNFTINTVSAGYSRLRSR